jgi:hypothetical protein
MLRIELEQRDKAGDALLRLDVDARRRLANVLADWLSAYAGVQPKPSSPDDFDLVVEVRRVLLRPDESNGA